MSMDTNDNQSDLNTQLAAGGAASAGGDYGAGEDGVVIPEQKSPVNRSTLVVFAILAIGAGGLFFMYRKAGPQNASASSAVSESAQAKQTISSFLSGGNASIKSMETMLRDTHKLVQKFLGYPSMRQVPLSELQTNPFRQHAMEKKSEDVSEAAEKKKREEERLAIKKQADSLQVQSILCSGSRKACVINNAMYREGQAFDNFTVEKINPGFVVVRNGPYLFELRIQR